VYGHRTVRVENDLAGIQLDDATGPLYVYREPHRSEHDKPPVLDNCGPLNPTRNSHHRPRPDMPERAHLGRGLGDGAWLRQRYLV
jgi:hypothetical protein